MPRTLTVTEAIARATAKETASADVEAWEIQGQVVHCANASLEALATAFLESPEATAELEAEQSAVRWRARAGEAMLAKRSPMQANKAVARIGAIEERIIKLKSNEIFVL